MVFASICEHASIVFIFTSTNSCQIFLASSEHFEKYRWRAASSLEKYTEMVSCEHFEYLVNFSLAGISLLLIWYVVLRQEKANKNRTVGVQLVPTSCGQLCPRLGWSSSYGKKPLLWALLSKKSLYHCVLFLKFTVIYRKISKIILKCFS